MGVTVNEARCNNLAFGVQFPMTLTVYVPDADDPAVCHGDITTTGITACPIDDCSIPDDQIMRSGHVGGTFQLRCAL
jgi:hypothetical protein